MFQLSYGLHFYMDSNDRKCFLEEVPADTLVSGVSGICDWIM